MWSKLALYDPSDLTTALFSFIDAAGTSNPYGLKTKVRGFDRGSFEPEVAWFDPDIGDGSRVTKRRYGRVAMQLHLRIDAGAAPFNTHDSMRAGVARMLWLFQRPMVLIARATGATEDEYLYTQAADVTQLLRGPIENLDQVMNLLRDPDGYVLTIYRDPAVSSPELDPAVQRLTNEMFLIDLDGAGRPDGWTWSSTTNLSGENIDAANEAYEYTFSVAAQRGLRQETGAATAAPGDVWTASVYAETDQADGGTRLEVVIQYEDNVGGLLGSESTSGLTALTAREQRIVVTSSTAPASTDRLRVTIRCNNTDATARTIRIRRAQLEKASAVSRFRNSVVTISMDPTSTTNPPRMIPLWHDGNVPVPVRLEAKADSTGPFADFLIATRPSHGVRGTGRLADWLSNMGLRLDATANGWTITLSNDTTDNGTEARTTHATNPTIGNKRIRITRTTKLDAMRGVWDVWVRVKATNGSSHELQLKWSPSLADPALTANDAVLADTDIGAAFVEVYLGRIAIPRDRSVTLAGVALELWSRRVSGTGSFDWSYLTFVPADVTAGDRQGTVTVPGGANDAWSHEVFIGGASFTNPGALTNGSDVDEGYVLDTAAEAAGAPPAAGITGWVAGQHRIEVDLYIEGTVATASITFANRNITDSSDTTNGGANMVYDVPASPKGSVTLALEFVAVAGKTYQPQLRLTSITGTAAKVYVKAFRHQFISAVLANEIMRSDPGDRYTVEKLDSSKQFVTDLDSTGAVMAVLEPGLNLLHLRALKPQPAGYTSGESDTARSIILSPYYQPASLV